MDNIKISNTDGIEKEFKKNTTYYDISKGFNLGKDILGVKVNNEVISLEEKATTSGKIEFIDLNDLNGNKMYKSALEFIFEVALKEIFPDLDITYQHSVAKGFLGEIIGDRIITIEDLNKIKSEMAKIIADDIVF